MLSKRYLETFEAQILSNFSKISNGNLKNFIQKIEKKVQTKKYINYKSKLVIAAREQEAHVQSTIPS